MAEERVRASSSSSSLFTLNRPKGLENKRRTLLIPLTLIPRAPHCALHILVQFCVTHSYRLCLVPSSSSLFCPTAWHTHCADLRLCLAHTGTGPITLSPDQKDHLTLASSSLSHCSTKGSLQISHQSLWAQG